MLTNEEFKQIASATKERVLAAVDHPENELVQNSVKIAVEAAVVALNEYEKIKNK